MATFKIANDNSVVVSGLAEFAFADDTLQADTLTVDAGAFLISQGAFGIGAFLASTLGWKVTVNGSVTSVDHAGIYLDLNNTAASTITIGADGVVGGRFGLYVGSAATIKNSARISGTEIGIRIVDPGARTITNSDTIFGGLFSILDENGLSTDKVTNTGELIGNVDLAGGNDSLTNSGLVDGAIQLGAGINSFANSGEIKGTVSSGGDNDTFQNQGTIDGSVALGEGTNLLNNSGDIFGGISAGSGNDTIINSGTINGGIWNLGGGDNTVTNTGVIDHPGVLVLGAGNDTVTNKGTISPVSLGAGNDTFNGGNQGEFLGDGADSDTYRLGAGNDSFRAFTGIGGAGDGTDFVDGGTGVDLYFCTSSSTPLVINLDTVAHNAAKVDPIATTVHAASTATGADIAGSNKDTILGFEDVIAGDGNDIVYGSAVANVINGGAGQDYVLGFGGNDRLTGGNDNDRLHGGLGKDILEGGAGADGFFFSATNESGPGAATRDTILDFTLGPDYIDVSKIDADTTVAGHDAFNFKGVNVKFTGDAGELRAYFSGDGLMVEGDVNGDKKADFSVFLVDPTHALNETTFMSANFVLF